MYELGNIVVCRYPMLGWVNPVTPMLSLFPAPKNLTYVLTNDLGVIIGRGTIVNEQITWMTILFTKAGLCGMLYDQLQRSCDKL